MVECKESKILFVDDGYYDNYLNYIELYKSFQDDTKPNLRIGGLTTDVSETIDKINSNEYAGILLNSLVIPLGKNSERYRAESNKFNKYDNPLFIWRSGGLFLVEQANKKGLVSVVVQLAEEQDVLTEANKLGATIITNFSKSQINASYIAFKLKLK